MNKFNYIQPKSFDEAAKIFKKNASSSILFAGGTDVLGMIKNSIITPENLVNLKSVKDSSAIKYISGKELQIGALVTLTEIAEHPVVKEKFTALAQAANEIASPQFRNIATIGGNICQRPRCMYFRKESINCLRKGGDLCYAYNGYNKYHCIVGGGPCYIVHPSDSAVALLALDAKVSIYSLGKSKVVPIKDFFILPETDHTKENILKPGEIIEKIIIPEPESSTRSRFVKFKERDVWDFAVVSIAAVALKKGNRFEKAKLAFGGVAPVPWNSEEINKLFAGIEATESSLKNASDKLFVQTDILEKNGYKIPLVRNLTKRLLMEL